MSDQLRIGIHENRVAFHPGEEVTGAVLWECAEKPTAATLFLRWHTTGYGSEDSAIVLEIPMLDPQAGDTRDFHFRLPAAPYSFRGELIALQWSLGIALEPTQQVATLEIVLSPTAEIIVISSFGSSRSSPCPHS